MVMQFDVYVYVSNFCEETKDKIIYPDIYTSNYCVLKKGTSDCYGNKYKILDGDFLRDNGVRLTLYCEIQRFKRCWGGGGVV